jgi:peptidoglycan-associated lipoprotein
MNVGSHFLVLSAVVMAVALAGCDSGPSAPKSQAPAPEGQPAATAPASSPSGSSPSALPREFAAASDLRTVHFDLDQAKIRPQDARALDSNARWLKSRRDILVRVGGHADERGSDEYNVKLGERRAEAVKKYLIAQGIEANRITIMSHGEQQPICADHAERCWSQNRRAEFQVRPR